MPKPDGTCASAGAGLKDAGACIAGLYFGSSLVSSTHAIHKAPWHCFAGAAQHVYFPASLDLHFMVVPVRFHNQYFLLLGKKLVSMFTHSSSTTQFNACLSSSSSAPPLFIRLCTLIL